MSQSSDKRAMNFLPPLPKPLLSGPSELNASFITHNPIISEQGTCFKTVEDPHHHHLLLTLLHLPQTHPNPPICGCLWPWTAGRKLTTVGVWSREEGGWFGSGVHPFRSGLLSGCGGLGGKELNKPKGLGPFSCDTPLRLSRGLGGPLWRDWKGQRTQTPLL